MRLYKHITHRAGEFLYCLKRKQETRYKLSKESNRIINTLNNTSSESISLTKEIIGSILLYSVFLLFVIIVMAL